MMPVWVIFLIMGLISYFIYWKPLRTIKRYVAEFRKCGFKVYYIPFNPFSAPFFDMKMKNIKNGDPMRAYKTEFVSYDMLIGNVFMRPAIQMLSPSTRRQLIKHEVDFSYEKLPELAKQLGRIIGKGLLFSEGEEWKGKRRVLSKFFTFQFLNSKIADISKICEKCLDELQIANKTQIEKTDAFQFKLLQLTSKIFSSVILSIFLGSQSLEEKIEGQFVCHFLQDLMSDHSVRIQQGVALLLGPKFLDLGLTKTDADINRRKKLFDGWVVQYLDFILQKFEKEGSKTATNIIELLYHEKMANNGQGYSKEDLLSQLKTFFFAGTDTTSHFAEMMIYLAARFPEVKKKVDKQISDIQYPIQSANQLKKMKYIQSIQKETLRYCGPLNNNVIRIVKKQHDFSGVRLSSGTVMQYYSVSTHYNEDYYNNPFEFNPQRWSGQKQGTDPIHLVGFGMGPRTCIGQQLAMIQSKIAFYSFFKRYKEVIVPENIEFRWKTMLELDIEQKTEKQGMNNKEFGV